MDKIIWSGILKEFVWRRVILIVVGLFMSAMYLLCTFVLYPSQAFAVRPGIYKITLWGGLNVAVMMIFVLCAFMMFVFCSEVVSAYRYYKQQTNNVKG